MIRSLPLLLVMLLPCSCVANGQERPVPPAADAGIMILVPVPGPMLVLRIPTPKKVVKEAVILKAKVDKAETQQAIQQIEEALEKHKKYYEATAQKRRRDGT